MSLDEVARPGRLRRISAADWGDILNAARLVKSGRAQLAEPLESAYPSTIARIRNDSGQDLDRFDVVGLDAPLILPGDNIAEFLRSFSVVPYFRLGGLLRIRMNLLWCD